MQRMKNKINLLSLASVVAVVTPTALISASCLDNFDGLNGNIEKQNKEKLEWSAKILEIRVSLKNYTFKEAQIFDEKYQIENLDKIDKKYKFNYEIAVDGKHIVINYWLTDPENNLISTKHTDRFTGFKDQEEEAHVDFDLDTMQGLTEYAKSITFWTDPGVKGEEVVLDKRKLKYTKLAPNINMQINAVVRKLNENKILISYLLWRVKGIDLKNAQINQLPTGNPQFLYSEPQLAELPIDFSEAGPSLENLLKYNPNLEFDANSGNYQGIKYRIQLLYKFLTNNKKLSPEKANVEDPTSSDDIAIWKRGIKIFNDLETLVMQELDLFKRYDMYLEAIRDWLQDQAIAKQNFILQTQQIQYDWWYVSNILQNSDYSKFKAIIAVKDNKQVINTIYDKTEEFINSIVRNKDLIFNDKSKSFDNFDVDKYEWYKDAVTNGYSDTIKKLEETSNLDLTTYTIPTSDYTADSNWMNSNGFVTDKDKSEIFVRNALYELSGNGASYFGSPNVYGYSNNEFLGGFRYTNIFQENNENKFRISLTYRNNPKNWNTLKEYAKKVISKYISKDHTDLQKARIINDFITWKVTYADEESKGQYINDKNLQVKIRDPYEFVVSSKPRGVCEMYARMFNLLASYSNFKSWYITGDVYSYKDENNNLSPILGAGGQQHKTPHAWNLIYSKQENKYYYLDATFNDPVYVETPGYIYFERSTFKSKYLLKEWKDFDPLKRRTIDSDFYNLQKYRTHKSKSYIPLPNKSELHQNS
ncbi:transglutaminase domain-containing protein [Metamycoplasma hyosynoviae]|uniref:transglutaminase domain-containing protein n=2 Tax=Metamycoplasma hyosynoviae TaxID=29559 RepID=UPI0023655B62|nr:transglutaminase domain-containing protein [Metamycoplasma hyosynoviae]MDD7912244.1 transglutaminase domain-containing protein [Metamycoplasma hyosynoviae]